MKRKIASALFILVCGGLAVSALMHMMGDAYAPASGLSESENRILAQVLAHRFGDGGYNVVSPKTVVAPLWGNDAGSTEARRQQIVSGLEQKTPAAASMVARLYQRNAASVQLVLKSDPGRGYIVDDGSYEALLKPDGGGWKQWRAQYPKAHGYMRFSRPVYDPATGLFLIYVEGRDADGGIGVVKMMKDDHGAITTVGVVQLWKR
jgi:hypothetical protein